MAQRRFDGLVLALDLAGTIGWACGRPGALPAFGHQKLQGATRAGRYRHYRSWLEDVIGQMDPDVLIFEAPIPFRSKTNFDTMKFLIGLAEHLEEWAYDRFDLREARVAAVRQHFIGANLKSAIAKPRVQQRCRALGWMAETHDESDALALLDYQLCILRPDLASATSEIFSHRAKERV